MRCIVVGLGIQGHKRKKVLQVHGDYVCSVDPNNMEAEYRDIIDVPLETYDAAMVCVPPDQKRDIIVYLLQNKKHVLVEKPLLGRGSDFHWMDLQCEALHLVCYVAYNHRFEPHIIRLRDLIQSGELGELYHCRMFYGNGTAQSVKTSPWRDSGYGVMSEIGTHLFDLSLYLFNEPVLQEYPRVLVGTRENVAWDHVIVRTQGKVKGQPSIELEVTYLSWKNTFNIDLYGSKGSAHIDGLTKWGVSKFTHRTRQFPPGVPSEDTCTRSEQDQTWELEYLYFKKLCEKREHPGLERDIMINKALENL